MDNKQWQPTNKLSHYNEARVAKLDPIQQAIDHLQLPPIRLRKLNGIRNALEMQIEDGGDSPEVNDQLIEALRLAVIHQVGRSRATVVLREIDEFARTEKIHWKQVQTDTLPLSPSNPNEALETLIQTGYELLLTHQGASACDHWLVAWNQVMKLATPAMRTVEDFDNAFPGLLHLISDWSQDLEMELHNAGLSNPVYFEHRIRYVQEYLAQFPDDDADRQVTFRRAEGEALWQLSRTAESEAVYQTLVVTFPDKAWGYIGWSDQYYLWGNSQADYVQAEKILRQALARPKLDDRGSVQDRLVNLHQQQKKAKQATASAAQQQPRKQKRKFGGGWKRQKKK